jgi:hypothetical protein
MHCGRRANRGCIHRGGDLVSARIYRYTVPLDDEWHEIALSGAILHVAARQFRDTVEFWALYSDDKPDRPREFRVFGTGTGHPLTEDRMEHRGTALIDELVWHLMERLPT